MKYLAILGLVILGGLAALLVYGRALTQEESRPLPPAEVRAALEDIPQQASVPPRTFAPALPPIPVERAGQKLAIGSLTVDLDRAAEELTRLLAGFRAAHVGYRTSKRDGNKLRILREHYMALSELLRRFPELGMPFYRSILTEADQEIGLSMAKLLKLSAGEDLVQTLTGVLDGGGPPGQQLVAVYGLEGRSAAEPNRAMLASWQREQDAALRAETVRVLSRNLAHSVSDEPARAAILESFREAAQKTSEPARRIEAVQTIVTAQSGIVPETDRALIDRLVDAERDPHARLALTRLQDQIAPTLNAAPK